MLGKVHRNQCDCHSKYVTGKEEKCNKRHGSSRQRTREKRQWNKELPDNV